MNFNEDEIAYAIAITQLGIDQVGVTHGRFKGEPVTVLISLADPKNPQPLAIMLTASMADSLQIQGYTFTSESD